MEQKVILVKAVLLGSAEVGKSSLTQLAIGSKLPEEYRPTIGVEFVTFRFEGRYKFQLWDTAGQERFQALTRAYVRGAKVLCFVYSITDKNSFNEVEAKLNQVKEHAEPSAQFILIGTKNDLSDRKVLYDEGQSLANKLDMMFLEMSAKTDSKNVFISKLAEAADKCFFLNPPTPEA